ncbi:hypothetical protein [Qingshengfaniella alkalisoli]|uniref:Uncharacterized protein n=1 Tax=Qingshengfaniella alkalisoli TaxID=2599296 RepID=A0A5B8I9Z0_9RHOB|nr:hypothetical protein [Qingshengfaniella alkalisoli]QDY71185.1 hypothetical protein FPZ52_15915 [Qingshengfaniella alkalisoli]
MPRLGSYFAIWQQTRRRKGRVDDHEATDPGDQVYEAQIDALDAALPAALSVVGNARSILSHRYGAEIDKRPTIRFNRAQITEPSAQGTRWDIGVTSQARSLDHYKAHPPAFKKLIFTQYFDLHSDFLDGVDLGMPILPYPMRISIELMNRLHARPTAGMQVLYLLDKLGRKDVAVFGFDWKATLSIHHSERTRDPHNHLREMRLAHKLIKKNAWQLFT